MSDKETIEDYSWLNYLPDNYYNSGRFFGGFFTVETAKELLIIATGIYMLTAIVLQPIVSGNILWSVRIALWFLMLSLNLLIRTAFNSSILSFLISLYEYFKLTKRYRYKRRDPAYVQRQKNKQTK